jgi:hypothetical protein
VSAALGLTTFYCSDGDEDLGDFADEIESFASPTPQWPADAQWVLDAKDGDKEAAMTEEQIELQ